MMRRTVDLGENHHFSSHSTPIFFLCRGIYWRLDVPVPYGRTLSRQYRRLGSAPLPSLQPPARRAHGLCLGSAAPCLHDRWTGALDICVICSHSVRIIPGSHTVSDLLARGFWNPCEDGESCTPLANTHSLTTKADKQTGESWRWSDKQTGGSWR